MLCARVLVLLSVAAVMVVLICLGRSRARSVGCVRHVVKVLAAQGSMLCLICTLVSHGVPRGTGCVLAHVFDLAQCYCWRTSAWDSVPMLQVSEWRRDARWRRDDGDDPAEVYVIQRYIE